MNYKWCKGASNSSIKIMTFYLYFLDKIEANSDKNYFILTGEASD